jgi:replicative DNA helicase
MGVKAIRRRCRAIALKIPYDSLRRGILTKDQKERYYRYIEEVEKNPELAPFVVLGHDLTDGTSGVSSIIPKIERYLTNGGVLFIDGIYLIPDDRGEKDWKAITNVAMDLKILAQRYRIPIITTTQYSMQSKADRPHLEGAAYGKYVVQYADLILALSRDDVDIEADRGKIHVLGQREGDTGEFSINMKFDPIDFSQRNDKSISDNDDDDEEVLHV